MAAAALAFDRQPKPHGVTGRLKEEWPPLPPRDKFPQYRVDAVLEWMCQHRNVRRPPEIAAPLLAVICWLFDRPEALPLPTRERLATWITGDASRSDKGRHKGAGSIDAALTTALGRGEVREEIRIVAGRIEGRESTRRFRYIVPSNELLDAYRAPKPAAQNSRARN